MQNNHFPKGIAIRRHCIQQLLHDALSASTTAHGCPQGLLAGRGNMIEKYTSVTNIDHLAPNLSAFCKQQDWVGIYLVADQEPGADRVQRLSDLVSRYYNHSPACFLLLESSHKGRVEAQVFADAACTTLLPLALQEDGDLYPTAVNR